MRNGRHGAHFDQLLILRHALCDDFAILVPRGRYRAPGQVQQMAGATPAHLLLVYVGRPRCWCRCRAKRAGRTRKPAPWAPAVCYSSLFVGRLLYGRWHFCDGHQGARDLI